MRTSRLLHDLGSELLRGRKEKHLSLANTSSPAKISPTYLQKLERGEVQNPSPRVLQRLAEVLDLSYMDLMQKAKYLPVAEQIEVKSSSNKKDNRHTFVEGLSREEWIAVQAFVKYLRVEKQ